MVLTDHRRKGESDQEYGYQNIFLPIVCGKRERQAARDCEVTSSFFDEVQGNDNAKQETTEHDIGPELNMSMIEGWTAFEAARRFCTERTGMTTLTRIVKRKVVEREMKKYQVKVNTASIVPCEGSSDRQLELLGYFDPSFL